MSARKIKCWSCDGQGHKAFECPKKIPASRPWLIDSTIPQHVTFCDDWLSDKQKLASAKKIDHFGTTFEGDTVGRVALTQKISLGEVLFAPNAVQNFFSVTAAADRGFDIVFSDRRCFLKTRKHGKTVGYGKRVGSQFFLNFPYLRQESAGLAHATTTTTSTTPPPSKASVGGEGETAETLLECAAEFSKISPSTPRDLEDIFVDAPEDCLTAHDEPATYLQALRSERSREWSAAMNEEMASLEKNGTWELVPLPDPSRISGCIV
jgi:hypothetical protein